MNSRIQIIIADPKKITRDSITHSLSKDARFEIVGEVSNGRELLERLKQTPVNVVVLDPQMPVMSGREAMKVMRVRFPEVKVIILSGEYSRSSIVELILMGARSYLSLHADPAEIAESILHLQFNKFHFNEEVTEIILEDYIATRNHPAEKTELSQRRQQVLKEVDDGKTVKEIATKLNISSNTVKYHKKNLPQKKFTQ